MLPEECRTVSTCWKLSEEPPNMARAADGARTGVGSGVRTDVRRDDLSANYWHRFPENAIVARNTSAAVSVHHLRPARDALL